MIAHGTESGRLDWPAVNRLLQPEGNIRLQASIPPDMSRLAGWVEGLQEGNRNSGLFWAACRAVEANEPGLLDELAAAGARIGLHEREIARTIESARRIGQRAAERQAEGELG
jgi:hypothetical protein